MGFFEQLLGTRWFPDPFPITNILGNPERIIDQQGFWNTAHMEKLPGDCQEIFDDNNSRRWFVFLFLMVSGIMTPQIGYHIYGHNSHVIFYP